MGLFCRLGLLVLWLCSLADFFGSGFFGLSLCLPAAPCSWLFACGVGLSLHSYRSISFAPVRGGTYFLCRRKESRQRKRAATASAWVSTT
jgi:hypothetical protein